jgi:pimeloyl-ACP methyl ester carboxylesterase
MWDQLVKHIHQINYVRQGDGPPVILVHGIAASLFDWDYLAPFLAGNGFQTLALDLLGHGDSAKPENHHHYHSDSLYLHLAAWIDHLHLDQSPILIGHSLGGFLCLKYALEQPEAVKNLILIDPLFSLKQLPPWLHLFNRHPEWGEKALRRAPVWVIKAMMGWDIDSIQNFSTSRRHQVAEDYKRASPKILHIVHSLSDLSPELSRVRCPTLVLWGEKDQTLKPDSFPQLVKQLPCAYGRSISQSGHQPHLGKPEVVNQIVLDFLEKTGKDPIVECVDAEIPAE